MEEYDKYKGEFLNVAPVAGIVILAYNNIDGWGWLTLILLFRTI